MMKRTLLLAASLALVPALAFAQGEQAPAQPDQAPAQAAPAPTEAAPTPAPDQAAPAEAQPVPDGPGPSPAVESREVQRMTKEATEIEPQPHDPTAHFNYLNFSYSGKDEYGGKFGDGVMTDEKTGHTTHEEEPMSAPFVLMLVNFGILLIILGKFGGPAARKIARERHDQIKTALDEAAKLREQAAKKLAEYEARIKNVDAEVKQIVDDIRASAEGDKKRILEAASAQAALMKRDAEQRIAAEIELARGQLTREVATAASSATEKLLKEKVTGEDQTKLVSTFIGNVQNRKEAR